MAFIIPRNQTIGEALQQAFGNAAPGLIQGAQRRDALDQQAQQQQAQQQLGSQFGLNLPQGINPQLGNLLLGQAQKASLDPGSAASGFTLSPGQQRFGPAGQQIAGVGGGGFTLGQGQQRFDELGQPIAGVAAAQPAPRGPSAFQEQQAQIDTLSAIPPTQRTPEQQAQLNNLVKAPAPKSKAGPLLVAKIGDESGLQEGTVYQAGPDGKVSIISEAGGQGLAASDKAKLAISQAKEFRDTPTVKNFRTVETMERGIQSALKVALDPKNKSKAFADQALVIGFNKLLDPSSVVRESEFARTPQGIALINRLQAGVEKIKKGGVGITNEDRQALAEMAAKLLNESKRSFNATFKDFETRAGVLGLNPKIVFGNQKLQDVTGTANTTTQAPRNFTPDQIEAELKRRGQ